MPNFPKITSNRRTCATYLAALSDESSGTPDYNEEETTNTTILRSMFFNTKQGLVTSDLT